MCSAIAQDVYMAREGHTHRQYILYFQPSIHFPPLCHPSLAPISHGCCRTNLSKQVTHRKKKKKKSRKIRTYSIADPFSFPLQMSSKLAAFLNNLFLDSEWANTPLSPPPSLFFFSCYSWGDAAGNSRAQPHFITRARRLRLVRYRREVDSGISWATGRRLEQVVV